MLNFPRILGLTLAATAFYNVAAGAPAIAPVFAYTPMVVVPGGMLTVGGARFNPASTAVNISVNSAVGQRTTLGAAVLSAGLFGTQLTVPAGLAPGQYFVNITDTSGDAAINLTGTLTVMPLATPWFTMDPKGAAPGGSMTFSANALHASAVNALAALVSNSGVVTYLGSSPVTAGKFTKSFTIPNLAPGSYNAIVWDMVGAPAYNATGPVTIGTKPPVAAVGFYPVGAAVNQATNRVYIPNAGDDTLTVLDGDSHATLATIPIGRLPCAIVVNPLTNRIYVGNINSHDVSVIDGSTNTVVTSIQVGTAPCAMAALVTSNKIFAGNYGDNSVSVIDGATNTVTATVPTPSTPAGMSASHLFNEVYIADGFEGALRILNGTTLQLGAAIPAGLVPDAVGVNLSTGRVYVGNFMSRTVTVYDRNTQTVVATVPVGLGPSGVAVDSQRNRIFVGNYMSDNVSVIDGFTNTVVATLPVGLVPDGITLNAVTGRVYSVESNSNQVSIIQQ